MYAIADGSAGAIEKQFPPKFDTSPTGQSRSSIQSWEPA